MIERLELRCQFTKWNYPDAPNGALPTGLIRPSRSCHGVSVSNPPQEQRSMLAPDQNFICFGGRQDGYGNDTIEFEQMSVP